MACGGVDGYRVTGGGAYARPVCEFGQVLVFEGKIELRGFSVLRVSGFYW